MYIIYYNTTLKENLFLKEFKKLIIKYLDVLLLVFFLIGHMPTPFFQAYFKLRV